MSLFKLRGELNQSQNLILGLVGVVVFLAVWWIMAEVFSQQKAIIKDFDARIDSSVNLDSLAIADSIQLANATEFEKVYPLLPPPNKVFSKTTLYDNLYLKDNIVSNALRSIWLNIQGYFWAILIAIPIGFLIGLFPLFRGMFSKQVDAMRYLPLTALTGVFIIWFGIEDKMKVAFLAFGIIVYLLPVVVQRIDEVKDVYLKTVFTLGATDWQTIKTVFIPSVMAKLMDDIRVLTAISWTYIIIAELVNRAGGIGSLIYIKARQGQTPRVFAILFIIILIGFLQDRIFAFIDKRIFPHKYYSTHLNGIRESQFGIYAILGITLLAIFLKNVPGIGGILPTVVPIFIITGLLAVLYGEFKIFKSAKVNG